MPLHDVRTHTVLSDLGPLEAEPEEKNRVVGDGGDGPNGEVKAAVGDASDPGTEMETGPGTGTGIKAESEAETESATETMSVAAVNGTGGRDDAGADTSTEATVPISAVMAAAASSSSAARTMPMPRIGAGVDGGGDAGANGASSTMRIPRMSAEDATRTAPIPNLGAEPSDVISNAVRDVAAEAMTMKMPAVADGAAFVEAPTEPLPVLRTGAVPGGEDMAGLDDDDAGLADSDGDEPETGEPAAHDDDRAHDGDDGGDGGGGGGGEAPKPAVLAEAPTVSFRRMTSTDLVLPETVAEVVAVVDAASKAIAAAEDAARQVAEAHAKTLVADTPPPVLDLRQPAQPAPVEGVLDLLAPVLNRPLLEVEQPALPPAADLMALHRAEFELEFTEPPHVAAGDEPPIPTRFGPGLAVLPHIEFPV